MSFKFQLVNKVHRPLVRAVLVFVLRGLRISLRIKRKSTVCSSLEVIAVFINWYFVEICCPVIIITLSTLLANEIFWFFFLLASKIMFANFGRILGVPLIRRLALLKANVSRDVHPVKTFPGISLKKCQFPFRKRFIVFNSAQLLWAISF